MLRHHISACFAALQRKLLDLLHDALPGLRASTRGAAPAAPKPFPGAPQSSPAIEVSPHYITVAAPCFTRPVCECCCSSSESSTPAGWSLLANLTEPSWSSPSAARKRLTLVLGWLHRPQAWEGDADSVMGGHNSVLWAMQPCLEPTCMLRA